MTLVSNFLKKRRRLETTAKEVRELFQPIPQQGYADSISVAEDTTSKGSKTGAHYHRKVKETS